MILPLCIDEPCLQLLKLGGREGTLQFPECGRGATGATCTVRLELRDACAQHCRLILQVSHKLLVPQTGLPRRLSLTRQPAGESQGEMNSAERSAGAWKSVRESRLDVHSSRGGRRGWKKKRKSGNINAKTDREFLVVPSLPGKDEPKSASSATSIAPSNESMRWKRPCAL